MNDATKIANLNIRHNLLEQIRVNEVEQAEFVRVACTAPSFQDLLVEAHNLKREYSDVTIALAVAGALNLVGEIGLS